MPDTATDIVLAIEDDPADQKLLRLAFAGAGSIRQLRIAASAEEALDCLRRAGPGQPGAVWPALILLDLNMPGMGGREFLRCLKSDEDLKAIPVIVLTTSDSDTDILDCYRLHASGYVEKPSRLAELTDAIRRIEAYWFSVCRRPPAPS